MTRIRTLLITEDYLRQNILLHEIEPTYGTSSWQYAVAVAQLARVYGTEDILDYGCGKGRLQEELNFEIQQYDPAIAKFNDLPVPADIVICGDVMEHVEPECVNDVIDHIRSLTLKIAWWCIATRPASKTLPDGRNCHLIVESTHWWIKLIEDSGFDIYSTSRGRKGELILTTVPK